MVEEITKNTFTEKVHNSQGTVIVDFYGNMCAPCKILAPVMDKLSKTLAKKAHFYKIEITNNQEIFAEYGVRSVPTTIIFKHGEPVAQHVGFDNEPKFTTWLTQHL